MTTTTTTTTTSGIMSYGSCVLSHSLNQGAQEYMYMEGADVAWSGGYYDPSLAEPAAKSPTPAPEEPTSASKFFRGPTILAVQVCMGLLHQVACR